MAALRVLLILALLTLAALPAAASTRPCTITTSTALVTVGTGRAFSSTTYVAVSGMDLKTIPMPWTYREMNGIDGLQRHDAMADDTCGDPSLADLLVW